MQHTVVSPGRRIGWIIGLVAALVASSVAADTSAPVDLATLQAQVRAAEIAFAKTMAGRDAEAFAGFISDEAVFFGRNELRGKQAIVAAWASFFEGPDAPFSWRPEIAVVLQSGGLGLTSGPVFDPAGKQTGTFNSTWRREPDGSWKVVFDKGCPPCESK